TRSPGRWTSSRWSAPASTTSSPRSSRSGSARCPASCAPTPTWRSRCTRVTTSNPSSPSERNSPPSAPRRAPLQAVRMAGVEETPLGTGGSVRQIGSALDDTFLVISGDALTDIDLSAVVAFHKERKAAVTLTLVRVANPLEYGVVITQPDGRITKFLEKPSWGEVFSD